jgi:hypothetical protein
MSVFPGLMVAWFTVVPFARQPPNPDDVKTGWVGFAVFLALAVAVVLLWLSFRKQLRKINFEEEPRESADRSSDRNVTPS